MDSPNQQDIYLFYGTVTMHRRLTNYFRFTARPILTILLLACPAISFGANLLTDGSFESATVTAGSGLGTESGALPGSSSWSVSNGIANGGGVVSGVIITAANGQANQSTFYGANFPADPLTAGSPDAGGVHQAYFQTDTGTLTLTQTVSVVAGKTYVAGFDLLKVFNGANQTNNSTISISLGGNSLGTESTSVLPTPSSGNDASAWTHFQFTVTPATTGTIQFSVTFTGGGSSGTGAKDIAMDRAFLIPQTPEVSTLFPLTVCIAAIASVEIARKRRRAIAE